MEKLYCALARKLAGRKGQRAIVLKFCLLLPLPLPLGHAQQSNPLGLHVAPQVRNPPNSSAPGSDLPDGVEERDRLQALNADRQKSMVSDTKKLLRLVSELNDEIARNSQDSLTPMQLHKVAEIEKLARNVKEKMSTSLASPPLYRPPPFPVR